MSDVNEPIEPAADAPLPDAADASRAEGPGAGEHPGASDGAGGHHEAGPLGATDDGADAGKPLEAQGPPDAPPSKPPLEAGAGSAQSDDSTAEAAPGDEATARVDDTSDDTSPGSRSRRAAAAQGPATVALDRLDDEGFFRLRDEGDVAALATDIARLGQLFPIELRRTEGDRFQVITGFRRVAALKFLHREKVLARIHTGLSDDDALLMALAEAIHQKGSGRLALEQLQGSLQAQGRLRPAALDMLQRALATDDGLAPEDFEGDADEEVDADELAADVTSRLGQINQDLSLLADVFGQLEPTAREELLRQLRYSSQLVAFLEDKA